MAIDVEIGSIGSGYNRQKIDENFENIETALQDGLSRTGESPNNMEADLDMDSHDILNVGTIQAEDITVDGENVTGVIERAEDAAELAEYYANIALGVAAGRALIYPAAPPGAPYDAISKRIGSMAPAVFGNDAVNKNQLDTLDADLQDQIDDLEELVTTINTSVGGNRVIPTAFSTLTTYGLNSVFDCVAPGQAVENIDLEALWDEKYGATLSGAVDMWVDWFNGADVNNGRFDTPKKTVKSAMAGDSGSGATCRRIMMRGSYSEEVPNWTASDGAIGGGTLARAIKIIAPPNFVFRNPTEEAVDLTWTLAGSVYTTTPATATRRVSAAFFTTPRTVVDPVTGISTSYVDKQIIKW